MKILAPLFSVFNKLDNHLVMPESPWYEEAAALIDQVGRNEYQHLVFSWLGFQVEQKMAWDAQSRYYWLRQPIKPGLADGMTAMEQVAATMIPDWYAAREKESARLSDQVGLEFYPPEQKLINRLSPTKVQRKFAHLQRQSPYLLSKKYPLSYTLTGRLLRGILHTAAIIRSPEMLEMVETFGLNNPEYILDVIHIYAQLPLGETVARCRFLRDRLHTDFPVWQIEGRLRRMGDKHKRPVKDLKAANIPTLGFDEHHTLVKQVGPYQVAFHLLHPRPFEFSRQQEAAFLSNEFKSARKALYAICRRGLKQLQDECQKIESYYNHPQKWLYKDWLPTYILHPFTGAIGKRLIWLFSSDKQQQEAIWTPQGFTTIDGTVLNWIDDKTGVELWHPVIATPALISQWQKYFIQNQILQPFRQAFRAVYRLAAVAPDDPVHDRTFQGHIMDWFLMDGASRNWVTHHFQKDYPSFNLKAVFSFERINEIELPPGITGHYFIRSGDIHFLNHLLAKESLVNIPALVYSETLHDIDCFVENSSIGNESAWEGARDAESRAAWHHYAFGELLASALIRKIILTYIIPQLTIADQLSIDGDYLTVNNYKIHIGSAQVLKGPGNEFVRVDASGNDAGLDQLFIPIEGDRVLQEIIEKVFILAR
ncbi:DUF4132 domain-containing protein [Chitinophaga silvisoli]|uniref:DUF4132 domain-containing protein n=2 Tax=Chitinophaga silvisoli TaxID=2291814 RepID=A0A3E1NYJ9_9BACT|nr:DUF4132 domain-containing protein [Chitinophaga silvisoli]